MVVAEDLAMEVGVEALHDIDDLLWYPVVWRIISYWIDYFLRISVRIS